MDSKLKRTALDSIKYVLYYNQVMSLSEKGTAIINPYKTSIPGEYCVIDNVQYDAYVFMNPEFYGRSYPFNAYISLDNNIYKQLLPLHNTFNSLTNEWVKIQGLLKWLLNHTDHLNDIWYTLPEPIIQVLDKTKFAMVNQHLEYQGSAKNLLLCKDKIEEKQDIVSLVKQRQLKNMITNV